MQTLLVEEKENKKIAYDSLVTSNPQTLRVLGSKLALNIIKELGRYPSCAIDIARRLKVHEQKVYYHIRKLEKAGLIYPFSTEKRHGMTAKIYSVVSPVVATKLFDSGTEVKDNFVSNVSSDVLNFFSPFIEDGKLNAKIIIGDPYPHGKYDSAATESIHIVDFLLFLGNLLNGFQISNYKMDTEIKESDLNDNLILIGNPKSNMIIDKINDALPIYFDGEKGWNVTSKLTGKTYDSPRTGVVVKMANPLYKDKHLLLIGGVRGRGVKSAVIMVTQHAAHLIKKSEGEHITGVVDGLDKDGDSIIDSIKFLE